MLQFLSDLALDAGKKQHLGRQILTDYRTGENQGGSHRERGGLHAVLPPPVRYRKPHSHFKLTLPDFPLGRLFHSPPIYALAGTECFERGGLIGGACELAVPVEPRDGL